MLKPIKKVHTYNTTIYVLYTNEHITNQAVKQIYMNIKKLVFLTSTLAIKVDEMVPPTIDSKYKFS